MSLQPNLPVTSSLEIHDKIASIMRNHLTKYFFILHVEHFKEKQKDTLPIHTTHINK